MEGWEGGRRVGVGGTGLGPASRMDLDLIQVQVQVQLDLDLNHWPSQTVSTKQQWREEGQED